MAQISLIHDLPPEKAGIGLRLPHAEEVIASRPPVGWLEVHTENHLCGGWRLSVLTNAREQWPISLHGVGLSLGSVDGVDEQHLARVARLADQVAPAVVSDHLSWSTSGGNYYNDLLPLPYTEEALSVVRQNVTRVQDRLNQPILIENPSRYLRFAHETIDETDFLAELVRTTGCGILLDVNNLYVSTHNVGGDIWGYLGDLPADAVAEIHLAGHSRIAVEDGTTILIDDHASAVSLPVWEIYETAIGAFPDAATLIEWDSELPPLSGLVAEAAKADRYRSRALAEPTDAAAA